MYLIYAMDAAQVPWQYHISCVRQASILFTPHTQYSWSSKDCLLVTPGGMSLCVIKGCWWWWWGGGGVVWPLVFVLVLRYWRRPVQGQYWQNNKTWAWNVLRFWNKSSNSEILQKRQRFLTFNIMFFQRTKLWFIFLCWYFLSYCVFVFYFCIFHSSFFPFLFFFGCASVSFHLLVISDNFSWRATWAFEGGQLDSS